MTNNETRRGRFKDGPVRISAITALVGLGAFLVGKGAKEPPVAATTVTATARGTGAPDQGATQQGGTPAGTTAPPSLPEGVQFVGEVVFGDLHLDFVPPKETSSDQIRALGGKMLYAYDNHVLAEWTSPAQPGRAECADQVSSKGFIQVDDLVKGSVVCGRTPEGRIFRLDVPASGAEIRATATVWSK